MQKFLQDVHIGQNLQRLRIERHLSQKDMVSKLALLGRTMSRANYAHIEQGVRNVYISDFILFKEILNVSYEEVIQGFKSNKRMIFFAFPVSRPLPESCHGQMSKNGVYWSKRRRRSCLLPICISIPTFPAPPAGICIPELLDLVGPAQGDPGLVGTGDFTHPGWRQELAEKLIPAEEGLYRLREDCRRLDGLPAGGEIRCPLYGHGGNQLDL